MNISISTTTKKIGVFLISTILLSACSHNNTTEKKLSQEIIQDIQEEQVEKSGQVLFIETETISNINSGNVSIRKTGRLMGSQEIMLRAQAPGRVSSILIKEGDVVHPDRVLIKLSDTIGNYGIMVQKSKVGLERAKLTKKQTLLQLDNAIKNTKHALDQAINNTKITKENLIQNLQQSKLRVDQTSLSGDSSTVLEIEKLQTEVDNQINSLKSTFQLYHIQATQLQEQLFDVCDQLFGISFLYKNQGDSYQSQLGVNQPGLRLKTKIQANQYQKREKTLSHMKTKPENNEELRHQLEILETFYQDTNSLITQLEQVLDFSVSGGLLGEGTLQGFINQINAQRLSYSSQYMSFVGYRNQVSNIFANKENSDYQTTLDQQIAIIKKKAKAAYDSANIQHQITTTQTQDAIFKTELAQTMAQEAYNLALRNRDVQSQLLDVAIRDAQVNVSSSQREYSKLTIISPINAIVSDVLVDKGDDVGIGTPLVKLVGTENNEVTIALDEKEIEYVKVDQVVSVEYQGEIYEGKIISVGIVADQTFGYPVTIKVDDINTMLGGTVTVLLPLQLSHTTLPLSVVELIGNDKGYVYLWKDNQAQQIQVDVGSVWGDVVEIITPINNTDEIIVSDMSNYDPAIYTLQKKKQKLELNIDDIG